MNHTFKNPDYDDKIPRYDISQVEKNDSIETSQHDLTKQAWFDPENKQSEQPVDGGAILDNFDPNYQRYNRTWFEDVDNSSEIEDKEHPYPPLPKSLQDDPSSTQFIQE
uniref:Uncharacterized protein n=1 Tax=Panagrolaimus sp. JU765 TaxID=591449 RepID=A0AC34R052_9BILA